MHRSNSNPKVERDIVVVVVVELEVEPMRGRILWELAVDMIEESLEKGDSPMLVVAELVGEQDYTKKRVVMVFVVVVDEAAVFHPSLPPSVLVDPPFVNQLQHSVVYSVPSSK